MLVVVQKVEHVRHKLLRIPGGYEVIPEYTKDTLFKPINTRPEMQKSRTDHTAKAILNEEKSAASAKTDRLRAARIARDSFL